VLFVIGGVAPLLGASALPLFLRVASGWEIFLQNFSTGAVAALLLGGGRQEEGSRLKEEGTLRGKIALVEGTHD